MPYYLDLAAAADRALVGGKAHYLGRLLRVGAPVPGGGAITTQLLYDFLAASGCQPQQIDAALQRDPAALEAVNLALRELPWPTEQIGLLKAIYQRFDGPICVRSSAVNEDGAALSFAGVYRSHVNIRTFGEFANAVRDIWSSAFGIRAQDYAAANSIPLAGMGVVVQEFVDAVASGVAFLQGQRLMISAAYGLCEGVVSGRVPCDTIVVDGPGMPPQVTIASKEHCHLASTWPWYEVYESQALRPWSRGSMLAYTVLGGNEQSSVAHCAIHFAHGMRSRPVLGPAAQAELTTTIYRLFGGELPGDRWDIEWSVDRDERLFMLQARPLTAAIVYPAPAQPGAGGDVVRGHPISPGVGAGLARHIASVDDLVRVEQGDVLIMDWIPDSYLGVLSKASALVISDSTPLSHCAIIARERKIPCVGGIVRGKLADGRRYVVDGGAGTITPSVGAAAAPPISAAPAATSATVMLCDWLVVALNDVAARPQRIHYQLHQWGQRLRSHAGAPTIDAAGVAALYRMYRASPWNAQLVALLDQALAAARRLPNAWQILAGDADWQALGGLGLNLVGVPRCGGSEVLNEQER